VGAHATLGGRGGALVGGNAGDSWRACFFGKDNLWGSDDSEVEVGAPRPNPTFCL
jgi:hypothetical protein